MNRRTIHPEIRVLDKAKGIVEYVASDETLDSYREVIRSDGWRFNHFKKNSPFLADHNYQLDMVLGKVIDFKVEKKKLVETVQFAIDVPENDRARKAFAMTEGGYLKAVSVGFWPVRTVSRWDTDRTGYDQQLSELEMGALPDAQKPRAIYLEQEQIELSAVVIGANPNALMRAYQDGVIDDPFFRMISRELNRESATSATDPGKAEAARRQAHERRTERLRRIAAKF